MNLKKYYISHSLFRKTLDIIDDIMERFVFIYWIMLGLTIVLPTLIVFYSLPEDIRTPISSLVGGVITLVLIPLSINHINQKTSQKIKLYNENKSSYYELSKIIVSLMLENNKSSNSMLKKYIKDNYYQMCLTFNYSLIWDVVKLYEEMQLNSDNIRYYCEKILKKLRREAGLNRTFSVNQKALDYISVIYKEDD